MYVCILYTTAKNNLSTKLSSNDISESGIVITTKLEHASSILLLLLLAEHFRVCFFFAIESDIIFILKFCIFTGTAIYCIIDFYFYQY